MQSQGSDMEWRRVPPPSNNARKEYYRLYRNKKFTGYFIEFMVRTEVWRAMHAAEVINRNGNLYTRLNYMPLKEEVNRFTLMQLVEATATLLGDER